MTHLLSIVLPISIIAIVAPLTHSLIGWEVHRSQVKSFASSYGPATYRRFIKEIMNPKYDWDWLGVNNRAHSWSLFLKDKSLLRTTEVHADIIQFEGKGMQLDYISFLQFNFWSIKLYLSRRKTLERKRKEDELLWSTPLEALAKKFR